MSERVTVPCNGCTACCKASLFKVSVFLHADEDAAAYKTVKVDGDQRPALARAPNGDCVYLGQTGCTIWNVAPFAPRECRGFDCRALYRDLTGAARDNALAAGVITQELLTAIERVL